MNPLYNSSCLDLKNFTYSSALPVQHFQNTSSLAASYYEVMEKRRKGQQEREGIKTIQNTFKQYLLLFPRDQKEKGSLINMLARHMAENQVATLNVLMDGDFCKSYNISHITTKIAPFHRI